MRILIYVGVAAVFGVCGVGVWAEGGGKSFDEKELMFVKEIYPLLDAKCLSCHGKGEKLKGKLDLRTRESALAGGGSEDDVLVPGKPDASAMFIALEWETPGVEMPPKENDRLNREQVALFKKWIADGAVWPDEKRREEIAKHAGGAVGEGEILVGTSKALSPTWAQRAYEKKDLWAFMPLSKPAVPQLKQQPENPIDAFIERALLENELKGAGPADKRTLIRRVTYDLTGLPPTAGEVEAFVKDDSADAYEKLIERLLSSPRYGEKYGQHWLDVVRYADSSGFSNDYTRANAWRYRDYVIRSFNEDKPYDEFIREQIAGDEMEGDDPEHLIAVGFLRMGPWEHTGMSVAAVTRQMFLDDVTNSVGVTFLGQELRCAKCHDHKFDPIPTRDYYRFQAVFATTQFADREVPFLPSENLKGFEAGKARVARLMKNKTVRGLDSIPEKDRPDVEIDEDTEKKGHNKVNRKRQEYLNREGKRYEPYAFSVYSGKSKLYNSKKVYAPVPKKTGGKSEDVFILAGGALESPTDKVGPGVLSAVYGVKGVGDAGAAALVDDGLSGRRLALANWIASKENPLTARVMVNRMWQAHFGKGIAANPNNFGVNGAKPTHPELLDYLAVWFMENGWSVKKLHRLILTSKAYQRASVHPEMDSVKAKDPNNVYLSYFLARRLTAEEMRDSMLMASGELNLEMGGVPVRPEINMEVAMQPRHIMGSVGPAYQPSALPKQRNRRTIYAERIRTLRDPMLEVFNQPGFDLSCERRDASTVTPQVFTLFNSQGSLDRSIALAKLIAGKHEDDLKAQVKAAFVRTLGRAPSEGEIEQGLKHVKKMVKHHKQHAPVKVEPPKYVVRSMVEEMTGLFFYWVEDLDVYQHGYEADVKPWDVSAEVRALGDLCLVLFNTNEFVYLY